MQMIIKYRMQYPVCRMQNAGARHFQSPCPCPMSVYRVSMSMYVSVPVSVSVRCALFAFAFFCFLFFVGNVQCSMFNVGVVS
jgi:hypothetical protein